MDPHIQAEVALDAQDEKQRHQGAVFASAPCTCLGQHQQQKWDGDSNRRHAVNLSHKTQFITLLVSTSVPNPSGNTSNFTQQKYVRYDLATTFKFPPPTPTPPRATPAAYCQLLTTSREVMARTVTINFIAPETV